MRRDLTAPISPAPLPQGIALVPFTKGSANESRELMRRAYDGELHDNATTFEGFWQWLTTDAEYDPTLVYVATSKDQVVGFCLSWSVPYIKDLVVDEIWRRRGL